jgi:hypothetical protein
VLGDTFSKEVEDSLITLEESGQTQRLLRTCADTIVIFGRAPSITLFGAASFRCSSDHYAGSRTLDDRFVRSDRSHGENTEPCYG